MNRIYVEVCVRCKQTVHAYAKSPPKQNYRREGTRLIAVGSACPSCGFYWPLESDLQLVRYRLDAAPVNLAELASERVLRRRDATKERQFRKWQAAAVAKAKGRSGDCGM